MGFGSLRGALIKGGLIDPNVFPTGGFGSGLGRLARTLTPLLQTLAPQAAIVAQLVSSNFPPGNPPQALPQALTVSAAADTFGQPGPSLSESEEQQFMALLQAAIERGRVLERRERIKLPPERLISDQSGGIGLRKYIAPLRREPMATDISPSIQPSQEMKEFQWEVFTTAASQSLIAGEFAFFQILVPIDEAWEIMGLTVAPDFATRIVVDLESNAVALDTRVCQVNIVANDIKQLLYVSDGQKGDVAGTPRQDYLGWGEPLPVYGGETLAWFTQTQGGVANIACSLRYRRRPVVKTLNASPVSISATAV